MSTPPRDWIVFVRVSAYELSRLILPLNKRLHYCRFDALTHEQIGFIGMYSYRVQHTKSLLVVFNLLDSK